MLEEDAQALCELTGSKSTPFVVAWRVGKKPTQVADQNKTPSTSKEGDEKEKKLRERPMILKFVDLEKRRDFIAKRASLKGTDVFLGDDSTLAQVEHKKTCMPKIKAARQEGNNAFYRDGRLIITPRRVK